MRLWLLVAAFQVPSVWALSCPTGYQDGQNGFCYKPYTKAGAVTREVANKQCYYDGGRLPQIINAFTNNFLQNMASSNNMSSVWTGLICQTALKTSCKFDGAPTPLNSSSYDNFASGFPDVSHAPYGYLEAKTGKWLTSGLQYLPYICEVPIGNPKIGCSQNYTQSLGNCYKTVGPANAADIETLCQADDAHTVSIHSEAENNYTMSLIYKYQDFYLTGLRSNANNQPSWIDGSPYDYNNFGVLNDKYGDCVTVGMYQNTIPTGQWISSNCNKQFTSICKKGTVTTYPPNSQPQLTPQTCSGTQFLNGGGTIYSPNYPNSYNIQYSFHQNCEYILTGNRDIVTISFPELVLNRGQISLYNDVTDTNPFVKVYDGNAGRSYNSTGPVMKVVFNSDALYSGTDSLYYAAWSAFYY